MLKTNYLLFEGRFRLFVLAAFVLISLLAAIDIYADIQEGTDLLHISIEFIVFVISIFGASTITFRLLADARKSRD